MSIFAKKPESRSDTNGEADLPRATEARTPVVGGGGGGGPRSYGIADAIQLMRSLPVDQNVDLVVRVVRATLASLNVRVQDIIEDASRKEKTTQEGIAALHGKVAELEKDLDARRREITALEVELKETTGVKERLQLAEKFAVHAPPLPADVAPGGKHGSSMPLSLATPPVGSPIRVPGAKPSAPEEASSPSLKD
jgi:hypothetical protein